MTVFFALIASVAALVAWPDRVTWQQIAGPGEGILRAPNGDVWVAGGDNYHTLTSISPKNKVTVLNLSQYPREIARTADGTLWMNIARFESELISYNPKGGFKTYALGDDAYGGITVGADGNIWFIETTHVGKLTPQGQLTEYPTGLTAGESGITWGPDGLLWFGGTNAAQRWALASLDPATGNMQTYTVPFVGSGGPIVFDATGNAWYTLPGSTTTLMEFNPSTGMTKTFQGPEAFRPYGAPADLAFDRNGDLWYTAQHIVSGYVQGGGFVRFSPRTSTFHAFASPLSYSWQWDIAFGPHGEVWGTSVGAPISILKP